jgi:O-antigen ligase
MHEAEVRRRRASRRGRDDRGVAERAARTARATRSALTVSVRRYAVRLALSVAPGYVLTVFLASPSIPVQMKIAAALVLAVAIVRPAYGLVVVAAIAPLGDMITPLLQMPAPARAESLVVAFIGGWLASPPFGPAHDRRSVPDNVANAMFVFACVVVASLAATALQLRQVNPPYFHATWTTLADSYLWTGDVIGAHAAGNLLEGIALVAAASEIVIRDPTYRIKLSVALVASAAAVSIGSGLLAMGIAPFTTLSRVQADGLSRYSAAMHDLNAAASSYLLMIGVTIGLAASVRRLRAVWLMAVVAMLGGLVLTGSRAAVVAGAVVICGIGLVWVVRSTSQTSKAIVAAVLAAILLGAVVLTVTRSSQSSLAMRGGFTRASLRMIAARPLTGIGVGRYYRMSMLALPPSLAWVYGQENAHDYFLQTAAELGAFGAAAFLWLMAAVLAPPLSSMWRSDARCSTAAFAAAAAAYLLTAVSGHPFLVAEAAIPFWIVLGILAGERPAPAAHSALARIAAIAIGCVLLLSAPFRPGEPRMRLAPEQEGLGPLHTDARGITFREASDYASLFVEPNVRAVELSMRTGVEGQGSGAVRVGVVVRGAFQRDVLVGPDWSTLLVELPGAEPLMPRQRINLLAAAKVDVAQLKIIAAQ